MTAYVVVWRGDKRSMVSTRVDDAGTVIVFTDETLPDDAEVVETEAEFMAVMTRADGTPVAIPTPRTEALLGWRVFP